jgi:flagellin
MSDITLTAGIRQNLLSLQQTSADLTTTQEALATGKAVNSAADNPSAYFTSQNLTNSSNQLSALLDQIGQGAQTISAATNGLTGITSLLEQALSTAQQAQQAATPGVSYSSFAVTGTVASGFTESAAKATGSVNLSPPTEAASNLVITTGGSAYTISITASESLSAIETAINGTSGLSSAVTATDDGAGHLILEGQNLTTDFSVSGGTSVGLSAATYNATNLFSLLNANDSVANGDQLTVTANGGTAQTLTFGTAAGDIQTFAELNTALGSLTGVTASVAGGDGSVDFSVGASTTATSLQFGSAGSTHAAGILSALGLTTTATDGTQFIVTSNATRSTLQSNYNGLLTQIDQLAGDSGYNGVNLLGGNNLTIDFNQAGSSTLTIEGVTFTSAGLGLSAVNGNTETSFQSDTQIASTIAALNTAIATVQTQTETFGTNSGVIGTRQTFTTNMINTLQTGATNLVAADQNQESADLLTEQTQQQLEISALSIANQANQSVLKLFS